MNRHMSLVALFVIFLAMGMDATAGEKSQYSSDSTMTASTEMSRLQNDNCGVEGYSWLDDQGQPLGG